MNPNVAHIPPGRFVTCLRYALDSAVLYEVPDALEVEDASGHYKLEGRLLRVRPNGRFTTVGAARDFVEPLLRAWAFQEAVRAGYTGFRFTFDGAEVDGRVFDDPDHPREPLKHARVQDGPLIVISTVYPQQPAIEVSDEMIAIWDRFEATRMGVGEPLQSCAYYALTVIERHAGGREKAAQRFGVEQKVLRKLGELCSTRGDTKTARKAVGADQPELTHAERTWIDVTVRLLLLQVGMVAARETPSPLALRSLPTL